MRFQKDYAVNLSELNNISQNMWKETYEDFTTDIVILYYQKWNYSSKNLILPLANKWNKIIIQKPD